MASSSIVYLQWILAITFISLAVRTNLSEALAVPFKLSDNNLSSSVPFYRINLDLDPRVRWKDVVVHYKNVTKMAIDYYLSTIPKELVFFAQIAASRMDALLPPEFAQEIIGIAETVEAPLGDIVLLNIIYDVTAHCTGIIANDADGKVWHGRNLDYGNTSAQTAVLETSTIRVDFVRNNSLVYSGVTFAGYVGILTGWKPLGFAITVNQRNKGNLARNMISAAVEIMKGGKIYPVSMVARQAFESDLDFATASRRLMRTQLIAPVYYILSGVSENQGQVIVRSQFSVLGVHFVNQAAGRWFIVQTNYDPWVKPPPHDDRRDPALRAMRKLGQARLNLTSLLSVLSIHPVLNPHTAYTSVFSAAYPNQSITVIRGKNN